MPSRDVNTSRPAPGQPPAGEAGIGAGGRGFVMHHVIRILRRYRTDLVNAFGPPLIAGVILSMIVYGLALAAKFAGEGIR